MPYPLLAGLVGLLAGSYLNVVALRWFGPKEKSPNRLRNRSMCPACGQVLSWYELVPVASFLFQRGRCRSCRALISARYPLAEVTTACVWALIVLTYGIQLQGLALLVTASAFIVIGLIDLDHQLIPDQLVWPTAAFILAVLVLSGSNNLIGRSNQLPQLISEHWTTGAAIGALIPAAIVGITKGRGMGLGDAKLGALIGLTLGGPATLLALFSAFTTGALAGLLLIVQNRATLKSAVPFGPFLVLGWLIAVLWHGPILEWYTG